MSQYSDGTRKTFTAGTALSANLRVKITAATGAYGPTVGLAGASDPSIGTTEEYTASGASVTIHLANAPGTRLMVATAAAITANNPVYAAASGTVASTGTIVEGKAMETTLGSAGDVLEVMPQPNSDISTAIAGTTNATFTVDSDSSAGKLKLDTAGCTGDFTVSLALPGSIGQNTAITFPDPGGATATVSYLAFAQTVSGIKTHSADIIIQTASDLALGTTSDALLRFSAADASDPCLVLGLDDTSQQFHITDKAAIASDWNRSAGTHPELAIHSNTTPITDYLAIGNHDGTTAYIDVVGGTTLVVNASGTAMATFAAGGASAAGLTLTGGISAQTSTLAPFIPIGANAAAVGAVGTIPLTNYCTFIDSSGGNTTGTLAGGIIRGQLKMIKAIHANDYVVTVTTLTGGNTLTFTNVGEYALLLWTGAAWVLIQSGNELLGTNVGPAQS